MKKYVLFIICFALGCVLGYVALQTKISTQTVESQTDKQTIADLQKQLSQKQKVIRIYDRGVIQSETIDTDTTVDTKVQVKEVEKIVYVEKNKTEINPKKYLAEIGYTTDKEYYLHATVPIVSIFNLGMHCSSNFTNRTIFGLGLAIAF